MKKYTVVFIDESCDDETDVYNNITGTSKWEVLQQFCEMTQEECESDSDIRISETDNTLSVNFVDNKFIITEVK